MAAFSRLTLLLAWVAATLYVAAGAMLTWEVGARYLFGRPTIWAAELSQMSLIWGTLLGMAWALGARRHIAVDAVVQRLPLRMQRQLDVVAMLAIAVFSGAVTWWGADIAWDSIERGRMMGTILNPPAWSVEASVPIGFGLLAIQALIEAWWSAQGRNPAAGAHE